MALADALESKGLFLILPHDDLSILQFQKLPRQFVQSLMGRFSKVRILHLIALTWPTWSIGQRSVLEHFIYLV